MALSVSQLETIKENAASRIEELTGGDARPEHLQKTVEKHMEIIKWCDEQLQSQGVGRDGDDAHWEESTQAIT